MAPTYRNDSTTQSWRGSGFSGEAVTVPPGHSVATRNTITEVFMTKTSDAPYYSPNIEWSTVNSSGETKTRTVDSTYASGLEVYNRAGSSGEVQIKFNNASADYVAKLVPGASAEFSEAEILNRVSSVILECPLGAIFDFVVSKRD